MAIQMIFKRWALAVIAGGVGLWWMAGCDRGPAPVEAPRPEGAKRVGVLIGGGSGELGRGVGLGVESAAKAPGYGVHVFSKPETRDFGREFSQVLKGKEAEGMAGWIAVASGQKTPGAGVEKAVQRGGAVVLVDYFGKGEAGRDFLATVGTADSQMGRLAAQELVKLVGGAGRVFLMRGTSGSAPAKDREAGFLELMRRQMNIQVISDQVFGGDSPESARSKSEEFRKQILEASGIFCSTPEATLGVLQALRSWGVPGKKRVVGIGSRAELVEALRAKELQLLLVPDAKRMGEEALRMLQNHWEGNPVPAHREVPAQVLSPSNF